MVLARNANDRRNSDRLPAKVGLTVIDRLFQRWLSDVHIILNSLELILEVCITDSTLCCYDVAADGSNTRAPVNAANRGTLRMSKCFLIFNSLESRIGLDGILLSCDAVGRDQTSGLISLDLARFAAGSKRESVR